MGFLDPSGEQGRRFGSLGVALNEISTCLSIERADELKVTGPQSKRAQKIAKSFCKTLQLPESHSITLNSAIPEHVGLGSGTQMALAVGLGLSAFYGLDYKIRDIAKLTGRGARSGIGVGMFEHGGFIVDGGSAKNDAPPPVIVSKQVPENWRFILVFDQREQGLNGAAEIDAFEALPPFPVAETARLCHLLLMQALPALIEQDIRNFGDVITEIQKAGGEYFSRIQGGCFTSPNVERAIHWLEDHGAVGLGQSSWGPTGFCMVDGVSVADTLFHEVITAFSGNPELSFKLVSARNKGGEVVVSRTDVDYTILSEENSRYSSEILRT